MSDKKCVTCTDRYPACQDYCPIGIQAKQERQAQNEKVNKVRRAEKVNRDYVYEHYSRKG